jgi:hypothetical protein
MQHQQDKPAGTGGRGKGRKPKPAPAPAWRRRGRRPAMDCVGLCLQSVFVKSVSYKSCVSGCLERACACAEQCLQGRNKKRAAGQSIQTWASRGGQVKRSCVAWRHEFGCQVQERPCVPAWCSQTAAKMRQSSVPATRRAGHARGRCMLRRCIVRRAGWRQLSAGSSRGPQSAESMEAVTFSSSLLATPVAEQSG